MTSLCLPFLIYEWKGAICASLYDSVLTELNACEGSARNRGEAVVTFICSMIITITIPSCPRIQSLELASSPLPVPAGIQNLGTPRSHGTGLSRGLQVWTPASRPRVAAGLRACGRPGAMRGRGRRKGNVPAAAAAPGRLALRLGGSREDRSVLRRLLYLTPYFTSCGRD